MENNRRRPHTRTSCDSPLIKVVRCSAISTFHGSKIIFGLAPLLPTQTESRAATRFFAVAPQNAQNLSNRGGAQSQVNARQRRSRLHLQKAAHPRRRQINFLFQTRARIGADADAAAFDAQSCRTIRTHAPDLVGQAPPKNPRWWCQTRFRPAVSKFSAKRRSRGHKSFRLARKTSKIVASGCTDTTGIENHPQGVIARVEPLPVAPFGVPQLRRTQLAAVRRRLRPI